MSKPTAIMPLSSTATYLAISSLVGMLIGLCVLFFFPEPGVDVGFGIIIGVGYMNLTCGSVLLSKLKK